MRGDNSRLSAGKAKTDDVASLKRQWAAEASDDANLALYSRCHDAAKVWVHHTTASTKAALVADGLVLPLLPADAPDVTAPGAASEGYGDATTCQACHAASAVVAGNDEATPFPASLSYSRRADIS